jgi:hypothetical protein
VSLCWPPNPLSARSSAQPHVTVSHPRDLRPDPTLHRVARALASPRGAGVEGEDESWDFGTGAGFYVNATQPKWAPNYNMYDYITQVRAGERNRVGIIGT